MKERQGNLEDGACSHTVIQNKPPAKKKSNERRFERHSRVSTVDPQRAGGP